jgi:D-serine deaminase-like pyridoxal phosphate-dependent protein
VNRAVLDRATAALDPPFAAVDLDAFDANAADLLRRAGATALRLASVLGPGARDLALGDRLWFRHAKAGELCERFASLHLVRGEEIVDEVATYRGEGQTFL